MPPDTYEVAPGITGQVVWTRRFKAGYVLRRELWWTGGDSPCPITCGYSLHGDYVGDARTTRRLSVRYGISPEKRTSTSNVCSIGYSRRKRKWFGWSHRAIAGFKTRRQAAAFAESVS